MTEKERFWSKVRKGSGCWLWLGARNNYRGGYGCFRRKSPRKMVRAHRYAWEMVKGLIPTGKAVLHHCDNPPCVRPNHLFLGTDLDNVRDMVIKGRARHDGRKPQGEEHGASKLTDSDVRIIRTERNRGVLYAVLARRFGVGETAIRNIVKGVTWRSVK